MRTIPCGFHGCPDRATSRRSRRPPASCGAMASPVRLERDGNVAVLILSNPPLNLFTGGVDVEEFRRAQQEGVVGEAFGSLVATARRLEELRIPTLSLVHGLCLTAGLEISLACD